jgi:hypothetical protein
MFCARAPGTPPSGLRPTPSVWACDVKNDSPAHKKRPRRSFHCAPVSSDVIHGFASGVRPPRIYIRHVTIENVQLHKKSSSTFAFASSRCALRRHTSSFFSRNHCASEYFASWCYNTACCSASSSAYTSYTGYFRVGTAIVEDIAYRRPMQRCEIPPESLGETVQGTTYRTTLPGLFRPLQCMAQYTPGAPLSCSQWWG